LVKLNLLANTIVYGHCWISISVSESQTVEVQSGEEATLLCSNFTTSPSQIIWFRLTNRTQPRCISSIYTATDPASLCSGVQEGKYEMRSNISTVFLKMKDVDSSDSGLYFCGYYISRHPVIVSATYLKVQGKITTVFIYCVFICLCNYCPNKTTLIFISLEGHDEPRDDMDGKSKTLPTDYFQRFCAFKAIQVSRHSVIESDT
uniref:Ig-like domain-containing protein n=1 Tax=Lates calcarifer TaxID=8187 RepID=A0A4W6D997_LATCA